MMTTNYSTGIDLELEIEAAYFANKMLSFNIMTTEDPEFIEMVRSSTKEQLWMAAEIYSAIDVQLNPDNIVHWMAGNVFECGFRRFLVSSYDMLDVAYLAHAMILNDQLIVENLALSEMIRGSESEVIYEASWVQTTTGALPCQERDLDFEHCCYMDNLVHVLGLRAIY